MNSLLVDSQFDPGTAAAEVEGANYFHSTAQIIYPSHRQSRIDDAIEGTSARPFTYAEHL
jgi:hypothetical protein